MPDAAPAQPPRPPDPLLLWDAEGLPPASEGTAVLWRELPVPDRPELVSLPLVLEHHADTLRARYLAWLHDLGAWPVEGQALVDRLAIRPGFSAWWLSLLVEKCNYAKSPHIHDALRLLAFEAWLEDRGPTALRLVSANAALAACLARWCQGRGCAFTWDSRPAGPHHRGLRTLYERLPRAVQAPLWLANYLRNRWALRGVGRSAWRNRAHTLTFCSYLLNLNARACAAGRFQSQYWADLPDRLARDGRPTAWLHLYLPSAAFPRAGDAAKALAALNTSGEQTHVALDSFLDLTIVWRTLWDWGRLAWTGLALGRPAAAFRPGGSHLDLGPLFAAEWADSLWGPAAMSQLLTLNLLEVALAECPRQATGVFLQENQAWETSLLHAWRAAGHGRLIGAPHSTVRFWDLRYFFDPRTLGREGAHPLPLPDLVALNGPAAQEAYAAAGYPPAGLTQAEALRYLHLLTPSPASVAPEGQVRVLILGDYVAETTHRQLKMLESLAPRLSARFTFTFKPHPNLIVAPGAYPALAFSLTTSSLTEALADADVVMSSCMTSASLEAYCLGKPVVALLDPRSPNLSPLRGFADVAFVSQAEELHQRLSAPPPGSQARGPGAFFTLDAGLPRWQALLAAS